MTISALIVLTLGLLIPVTIFRYRIPGTITSIVLDILDVVLVDALQASYSYFGIVVHTEIHPRICASFYGSKVVAMVRNKHIFC